ncbi:four helix bundle protein [Salinimicrobium sp. WS361]|uniref:four helix bundle protein n=1 Tax=Salinimicrobium sp. WS361 TaxID=3425123 RepID=UPI003D6DF2DF
MAGNFEKLECWKKCFELKPFIKEKVLTALPDSEKFYLRSQLLRVSRSATANIAEGWGRFHYKENIKFLLNARGSVAEIFRSCY